ncbi:MAG: hypothetical protein K2Y05_12005 [Hyphomicrobiaceae bacterium]|nr:hypothetical protein [Hyphomicrobiaceae bacterium]
MRLVLERAVPVRAKRQMKAGSMFDWILGRQEPPKYVINLKLHEITPRQKATLGEMQAWIDELLAIHKFHFDPVITQNDTYDVRLVRNEDDPEWLRCTIEFRLYVDEDQRDRRHLGEHCSLLVDCNWQQTDQSPGVGMEVAFSKEGVAKARREVSAFFARSDQSRRNR